MDVFDWLDMIKKMRSESITQEAIGKRIGWSRDKVKNHAIILDQIGTEVLDLVKKHKKGRVPDGGTNVPIDFTEGGLRELIGLNITNVASNFRRSVKPQHIHISLSGVYSRADLSQNKSPLSLSIGVISFVKIYSYYKIVIF